jgi:hypothetical protein
MTRPTRDATETHSTTRGPTNADPRATAGRRLARGVAVALLAVTLSLVVFAGPAAAAEVSGTVTVANGTADGDRVVVTPLTETRQQAGGVVTTNVSGETFTAANLTDAPSYLVRVDHEGATHFAVVEAGERVNLSLTAPVSGRVVSENGAARAGVRVRVLGPLGRPVASASTDADGRFALGPVQSNATYVLRTSVEGVPHRTSVRTGTNATGVRFETPPPTRSDDALVARGGTPASHVLQVRPPANGSERPSAVETYVLRNTGDRPFVGQVRVPLPAGAEPYAAMYRGESATYGRSGGAVTVNATIAPGASAQVGVAYALPNRTLSKSVRYEADAVAVVVRGYNLSAVSHSDNLRVGDAPIPLLTTDGRVAPGDELRVRLPEATQRSSGGASGEAASGDAAVGAGDNSGPAMPQFPAVELLAALAGTVAVGIGIYRTV